MNHGQPSIQVLSYEMWLTRSSDVAAAGDHVADQPDPAHPATEADEDRRDRGDPAAPGQLDRQAPGHEGEDAGEQRARQEVDRDEVDARRRSR